VWDDKNVVAEQRETKQKRGKAKRKKLLVKFNDRKVA
jgi:hypothetical protein